MIAHQVPRGGQHPAMASRQRRAVLGQQWEEARFMDLRDDTIYSFVLAQGMVTAYALTASILYGKRSRLLDRILLGIGGLGFGITSAIGAAVTVDAVDLRPRTSRATGAVTAVFSLIDALIAIGAIHAAFMGRPSRKSAADAVAKGIPV